LGEIIRIGPRVGINPIPVAGAVLQLEPQRAGGSDLIVRQRRRLAEVYAQRVFADRFEHPVYRRVVRYGHPAVFIRTGGPGAPVEPNASALKPLARRDGRDLPAELHINEVRSAR